MKEIRKCLICGKTFEVYPSEKKICCSKHCGLIYSWNINRKRTRIKRICKECGKEYFLASTYKNDKKRGKYCSRECYLKVKYQNAKKFICEICGKEFTSGSSFKASRRACSRSCYNEILKKQWKNARELALKRDNYTCQICGIKEGETRNKKEIKLEVHHLDETGSNIKSIYMNNRLSNLVTLCHRCHMREEAKLKGNFHKGNTKESTQNRNLSIIEMYNNGISQVKISKLFGVTRQRIHQIVQKNNV